jgi:mannan endo-1,4-beta-mannosidase
MHAWLNKRLTGLRTAKPKKYSPTWQDYPNKVIILFSGPVLFIHLLPKGKILSGQFAGSGSVTFDMDETEETFRQTGKTPAILGCDWAYEWGYGTPPEYIIDYACNPALKNHWNKGGLVTINLHLPNPVSSFGGGLRDRMNLTFSDLINTATPTGRQWRLFLDRIAEGLQDLQGAGVTVIYRPLHEMNGNWFYWCNQDTDVFKNVWRDMFNYFTNTKNLHNLLWVYSPFADRGNRSAYYPGDSYVDIVVLDAYADEPVRTASKSHS